jgi:DIE2/ALG10 family
MLLAIHFNTIIHPFTLADNLHYVFYVFRVLPLHPAFKYAAIPAYITFAWLVINALRDVPENEDLKARHKENREASQRETS